MQRFALTLALLLAVLPWPPPANAGENVQSTKKLGKNYFVVREPNSRLQGRGREGAQRIDHGRQIALRQRAIRGGGHQDISRMQA
jgi:hypothetical protein